MQLVLSIVNVQSLENGVPIRFALDRANALIGRSQQADWSLPDSTRFVSNEHCLVRYADGQYVLTDISRNGTFLNGSESRMGGEHVLTLNDNIAIGPYRVLVSFEDGERTRPPAPTPAAAQSGWPDLPPAPAARRGDWPDDPARHEPPERAGAWPQRGSPNPVRPLPGAADPLDIGRHTPFPDADVAPPPWPAPAATAADDIWSRLALSNAVDWPRAGFGDEPAEPALPPKPAPQAPPDDAVWAALLAGANLTGVDLKAPKPDVAFAAGNLIRRLVAGLFVLLEARATAKEQLGARGTTAEIGGSSPIKYSVSADEALLRLLRPQAPGYLAPDRAVEAAFKDLQSHQLATLLAMQSSLQLTLERFSPSAIRARAQPAGFFGQLLPGARSAALWRAYEREFEGVVEGSDEAFMEVFASAFREVYEQIDRDANMGARRF